MRSKGTTRHRTQIDAHEPQGVISRIGSGGFAAVAMLRLGSTYGDCWGWPGNQFCEPTQVLCDSCERELILGATWATRGDQASDPLEMGEQHLRCSTRRTNDRREVHLRLAADRPLGMDGKPTMSIRIRSTRSIEGAADPRVIGRDLGVDP